MAAIPAAVPGTSSRIRDAWERLLASQRARAIAIAAGVLVFAAMWGFAVAYAPAGATLLCISFIACLFCLRDFRVGVAILVMIMPVSSSTLFPHSMFGVTGINPLNLLLVATLGVFLMRAAGTKELKGFIPRPLFWLYILPIAFAAYIGMDHVREIPRIFKATDMLYFDTPGGYLRDIFFKPLGLVVYSLLVAAAVAWSKRPDRFVIPMMVSVFVMAGVAIGFIITSGYSLSQLAGTYSRHFLSTIGMHANDLGRLYAVSFALLLFTWDRASRIGLKLLLMVAMITVSVALFLTFSRGAFFGFGIVLILYFALRRSAKTLALAILIVPAAIMFAPGALWYRVETGFGEGLNEITAGRYEEIWLPLIPEILKTPPWGSGLASILWTHAMRMEEIFFVAHPHNAYLQVYMDLGIVGTILVFSFWIYALRGFWRLSGDTRLVPEMQGFFEGAAVGLVSFIIVGISGSSFMPVPEQGYLWLALGLMWGVRKHLERLEREGDAHPAPGSSTLSPKASPPPGGS